MNVDHQHNAIVSTGENNIQKVTKDTNHLTNSLFDISPFLPTAIYSKEQLLFFGGFCSKPVRRAVIIVMNQEGEQETLYEIDKDNKAILTYPNSITTTKNNLIYVVDHVDNNTYRWSIVVLDFNTGDVINTYDEHSEVNKKTPFKPVHTVTSP